MAYQPLPGLERRIHANGDEEERRSAGEPGPLLGAGPVHPDFAGRRPQARLRHDARHRGRLGPEARPGNTLRRDCAPRVTRMDRAAPRRRAAPAVPPDGGGSARVATPAPESAVARPCRARATRGELGVRVVSYGFGPR